MQGDFNLGVETAKSPREISLGAIPLVAFLAFLAAGQHVVHSIVEIFSTLENVHLRSRNSWNRPPISGKMGTPTPLTVPPDLVRDAFLKDVDRGRGHSVCVTGEEATGFPPV